MSVSARYDDVIHPPVLGAHAALAETLTAVSDQLGRLATLLGRLDEALGGAEGPGLAGAIAPAAPSPQPPWSLQRDGGSWVLHAGAERGRFGDFRGFEHLQTLLANPHREVSASELDAGRQPLLHGLPTWDEAALMGFRRRLEAIAREVEVADRVGDQERSALLEDERSQVLGELRRATGLGGRVRTTNDAGERARVNVTRNLKRALEQVQLATPVAGLHLTTSIRTGTHCRYEPTPDGPARWVLASTGAPSFDGTRRSFPRNVSRVSTSPATAPRRIR